MSGHHYYRVQGGSQKVTFKGKLLYIFGWPLIILPKILIMLLNFSEKFTEVLRSQQAERAEKERERIRMLNADPFDADVQQKIAEEIRYHNLLSF